MQTTDPVTARVLEQMAWYDREASRSHHFFFAFKVSEIVAAAAIPIVLLLASPSWLPAVLGGTIAVLASLEQLFRFQENWINYRSACEQLRSELFLYDTGAGAYARLDPGEAPRQRLAERVAAIVSREHSTWKAVAETAKAPAEQPAVATSPAAR